MAERLQASAEINEHATYHLADITNEMFHWILERTLAFRFTYWPKTVSAR